MPPEFCNCLNKWVVAEMEVGKQVFLESGLSVVQRFVCLIVVMVIVFLMVVPERSSGANVLKTSLGDLSIFPPNNPWNLDVSKFPTHSNSDLFISRMAPGKPLHPDFGTVWRGAPIGMFFTVVDGEQKKVPIRFKYASESDPGPYPIPMDAPVEGGINSVGDRHVIVIDYPARKLYELFSAYPEDLGWRAGSGAVFDLESNELRPAGWTSADAAGLPIFPGLVRYDETVIHKEISHALRFTMRKTQRAFIPPARHYASRERDENIPPMGLRVRLKATYDISGFPSNVQIILRALKQYGMILADNGGDWFISGVHDMRWNDVELGTLKRIKGQDFEIVYTGEREM